MFDAFGLPDATSGDTKTYIAESTVSSINAYGDLDTATDFTWHEWKKPRNVSMVSIWALGGGGGGGAGCNNSIATTNSGGGGGGASGGFTIAILPAFMVSDVLYVQPGQGGMGGLISGTTSFPGANGGISYVSIGPYPVGKPGDMLDNNNLFLMSSSLSYNGGGAGTPLAAGIAGILPPVSTATNQIISAYSGWIWQYAGLTGYAGGYGAAGVAVANVLTSINVSGGAGGGGSSLGTQPPSASAGGAVTLGIGRFTPTNLVGGIASAGANGIATAAALSGSSGFTFFNPFMSCGGAGGGSAFQSAFPIGGSGGNGGIGSGGGGGGAGNPAGTGGNGGSGMIVITSW